MGAGRRICGIDIETTGLSFTDDHITEVAWVIKDVDDPKPLAARTYFVLPPEDLWHNPDFIKPNIEQLTKIKMKHLMTGRKFSAVMARLAHDLNQLKVDYLVAHAGENLDKPFLKAKMNSGNAAVADVIFNRTRLDTSVDCVYPPDCRHSNLLYVAAYFGFVNPFPHSALFDVMTMLRVLDNFDFPQVLTRAASPWCVVEAKVTYDSRDQAKVRRYWWETIGAEKYPKKWVKRVKECDLEKEQAEAPFEVARIA